MRRRKNVRDDCIPCSHSVYGVHDPRIRRRYAGDRVLGHEGGPLESSLIVAGEW